MEAINASDITARTYPGQVESTLPGEEVPCCIEGCKRLNKMPFALPGPGDRRTSEALRMERAGDEIERRKSRIGSDSIGITASESFSDMLCANRTI